MDLVLCTSSLDDELEIRKCELKSYVSSRPTHYRRALELRRSNPNVDLKSITKIEIEVGTSNCDFGTGLPVIAYRAR